MNEERFNNWTDVDNMKDHIRILEQRVDFMREKLEMLDKQEPVGEVLDERGEVDWISFVPPAGTSLYTTPPQRTEQNFCPRCGKRTNDIHTCTPPQGIYYTPPQRTWQGLMDEEIQTIVNMVATGTYQTSDTFARAIEAKLKQKNGFAEEKNT